jgi:hypothetical protein
VAEGLVEQKNPRPADHGPAQGDPLLLAARKLLGLAIEQIIQLKELGRLFNTFIHQAARFNTRLPV